MSEERYQCGDLPHPKQRDQPVKLPEEGREVKEKELGVVQFSSKQFAHQPSPVNVSERALKDCGVVSTGY